MQTWYIISHVFYVKEVADLQTADLQMDWASVFGK